MEIVKPKLSFKGTLTPIKRVTHLVQHHMAHKSWDIYDIHDHHINGRGWIGIGYNFWIGFDGTIYEGRGLHVGAHCLNHNSHTLGIGYQGDFTKQQMTDEQLEAGIKLNKYLMDKYGLSSESIVGHNFFAVTACPGTHFRMRELRAGVQTQTVQKIERKDDVKVSVLKKGDRGGAVRELQEQLIELGYSLPRFGADGHFGDETEAAVKAFQRDQKIKVDGIVGPETKAKLKEALQKQSQEVATFTLGGKRYEVRELK